MSADDLFGGKPAPPPAKAPPRPKRTEEPLAKTIGPEPVYRYEPPPGIVWDESMTPNPGRQPEETRGKRVLVQLADGSKPRYNEAPYPTGWAADSANWRKAGMPFDIARYSVIR